MRGTLMVCVVAAALAACGDDNKQNNNPPSACTPACASGLVCASGACVATCPMEETVCGMDCTDLQTDRNNCGECGRACDAGQVCDAGACSYATPVSLQLVTISDWHGQLDPLSIGGMNIGGAPALATYFQHERAMNDNTVILTAGDAFGASPPLSGFFNDEPAVQALNLMGIQADTFGNHNFDGGLTKLQHLIQVANYPFISSNLTHIEDNLMGVVHPYKIISVGGVKIALIGITNPDAPDLSAPGAMGTMTVDDPIASAMAARAAAAAEGATVFVAFAHMGATLYDSTTMTYSGPLIDFAKGVSGFNVIFGDHTDVQVNTTINGTPVVENHSKGATYARVKLSVTPSGTTLAPPTVDIVQPLSSAVAPAQSIVTMLAPYRAQLSANLDTVIGVASDVFVRGNNIERLQEVAIGDLLADLLRACYGTQLALINSGGIRAPLPSSYAPVNTALRRTTQGYAAGPPYDLVKGDVYSVLPFGNAAVTRTITGAQLWTALENGVSQMPSPAGRFPQISGFKFTYSLSAAVGMRVQSVQLADGTPIANDTTTYTLVTVDFVNNGGDGYTVFADGQGTTRDIMADVVNAGIVAHATITPTTDGRITQVP